MNLQKLGLLGGGNSKIFYVHPDPWGNDPTWLIWFQMGWFNHQLGLGSKVEDQLSWEVFLQAWRLVASNQACFQPFLDLSSRSTFETIWAMKKALVV